MLTEIAIALVIVFVCLLLHVAGILLMAEWLLRHQKYFERSGTRMHFSILKLVLISGIMLLHVVESSMWAAFYLHRRVVPGFRDLSLFFAGDLHGDRLWRCGTSAKMVAVGCD